MKKLFLVSLGCSKNYVDSEEIAAAFVKEGYVLHDSPEQSSVAVVNTCAFLREARLEALEAVQRIVRYKNKPGSKLKSVVLTGCLAGYYKAPELKKMIPGLDLVIPYQYAVLIPRVLENNRTLPPDITKKGYPQNHRFIFGAPHSVYIKISEGCDNRCAYCLIPSLRGKLRSKPLDDIISEAKALRQLGAKEINVIAQDTTAYGKDIYGKYMLIPLLEKISRIEGLKWIRLLYAQPSRITNDLLDLVAGEEKICKYLDIPIQHIDGKILRKMGRTTTPGQITSLYHNIRERLPSAVLRTTVMVGYPGEGEEEFRNLLDFLEDHPFERVGAFQFSPEKRTAAYFQGPVVEKTIAQRRLQELMTRQKHRSRLFNHELLGRELDILVDSCNPVKKIHYGRTSAQAPDVDGKVYLPGYSGQPGDFIKAKITGAGAYDIIAINNAECRMQNYKSN